MLAEQLSTVAVDLDAEANRTKDGGRARAIVMHSLVSRLVVLAAKVAELEQGRHIGVA